MNKKQTVSLTEEKQGKIADAILEDLFYHDGFAVNSKARNAIVEVAKKSSFFTEDEALTYMRELGTRVIERRFGEEGVFTENRIKGFAE